ncbi:MAG TPA: CehA/McbA family metallohydrolase [Bryobacteraceae bacterium]|nr:CehA/McbA family metallohydrolase [Bryobacteraceae bacterium]
MPQSSYRRAVIAPLFAILLSVSYRSSGVDRLEGTILDDETGQPVAAALLLSDGEGKPIEIEGPHSHVQYLGKRRCYVNGSFVLNSRPNRLVVEVRRGIETLPIETAMDLTQHGSQPLTFRLRRWIDMRKEGYVSGDTHVHFLSQSEAHSQMRAEDLNVLNLLVSDFTNDREKFTGDLDPVSTPGNVVYVGQESRDWQNGHVILLGIKRIVEPFAPYGGKFQDRNEPNLVMSRILRDARRQGGTTTWAHFCNLPGAESPIAIVHGLVDAIDLITYDDPTQLPSHWGPWTNSGMSQAEFTVMRSMDLYYQYLNSGFQVPIGAGTDKMGDYIPVGSNRLYARPVGEADYKGWLAGLKAGNGFVTNGPMLTFEVDGRSSGDTVSFKGSHRVRVRATAKSILPFQSLEIVVNGETAAVKSLPNQYRPTSDGVYSLELEGTIDLDRSSWLAARVAESPGSRNRILPRGLTVFAHTNPIYFLRDGVKVRERSSVHYLQKYVKGTIHWLNTGARFRNPAEKEEALRLAEEARQAYARLEK